MKTLSLFLLLCTAVVAAEPFDARVGDVPFGEVKNGPIQVPYFTWGGDVVTFVANGGLTTTPNSIFNKMGINAKLVSGDDFAAQTQAYIRGDSPFLRGTVHQLALVSDIVKENSSLQPVTFLQLTWSVGDHIVAKKELRTLNDLKGKTICAQQDGPHLALLDDSLRAAGLKLSDVNIIWTKDLTATPQSPAALFRSNPKIDAVCVISPDMLSLCSGLTETGNGREGTYDGAHVLNSTASMARSIADCYAVRADYLDKHKDVVTNFFVGWLKASEQLVADKTAYNDGKGNSPRYIEALKLAQSIYTADVLPTIEVEAHGLVSDANFVRVPGNEVFFEDKANLTGFDTKHKNALDLAKNLGFIKTTNGAKHITWDYKAISNQVGVKYVPPVYTTGRIKAEITDFADLDDDTIFTFTIFFEPDQDDFPVEKYTAEFQQFCEASATFSNAAVVIEGHADTTLVLRDFVWAAKAKGLLEGNSPNYTFRGKTLNLTKTEEVVRTIQNENLSGMKRVNSRGESEVITDPKLTTGATLSKSKLRVENVKKAIQNYASNNQYMIDLSPALLSPVGITNPVIPVPKNLDQAKQNMRVVFRVVRLKKAEAINKDDFNFDN